MLDFLSEAANTDYINQLLSTEKQVQLTQWIAMVGVVWRLIQKQVRKHFEAMEAFQKEQTRTNQALADGLKEVVVELKECRATLGRVEINHEKRIGALEGQVFPKPKE